MKDLLLQNEKLMQAQEEKAQILVAIHASLPTINSVTRKDTTGELGGPTGDSLSWGLGLNGPVGEMLFSVFEEISPDLWAWGSHLGGIQEGFALPPTQPRPTDPSIGMGIDPCHLPPLVHGGIYN